MFLSFDKNTHFFLHAYLVIACWVFVAENFEAVCFLSVAEATLFLLFCGDFNGL